MKSLVESRLEFLRKLSALDLLRGGRLGLEKECLRVSPDGGISRASHPRTLGSALTHPHITTDYSEALLEFITPPLGEIREALGFLCDIQTFVHRHLGEEFLWATSMPCIIRGEEDVPIACYGSSNAGRMKHIYRVGLGHRYGRVMQAIAGVHFNFSLEEPLWPVWGAMLGDGRPPRAIADDAYMGLLRNLQRYGWLVPYLFGASPAVCKSFFAGKPSRLEEFDESTYYEPYATSLRMGDIGYQNRKEEGVGVKACYDSLQAYVAALTRAIETPALIWEEIGVKVDGEYRQLNANILQIENEYYSSVRPKQLLNGLEKPSLALARRGIRYIELRSPDVNAYHPLGVDETQLRFLKAFMLCCLLLESPLISLRERVDIDRNLLRVAHRGREPGLLLGRPSGRVTLKSWAAEILEAMGPVCELLDDADGSYSRALAEQAAKVADPGLTPSARMLAEMRERGEGFYQFARRMSLQHRDYFAGRALVGERLDLFQETAAGSLRRQAALEAEKEVDFDRFLADYLSQK